MERKQTFEYPNARADSRPGANDGSTCLIMNKWCLMLDTEIKKGGRTAARDLKRVRSMPPWEVKILSCGPCECIMGGCISSRTVESPTTTANIAPPPPVARYANRCVSSFVCLGDVLGFVVCPPTCLVWLHCVTDEALGFFCWRHVKSAWPQTDVKRDSSIPCLQKTR